MNNLPVQFPATYESERLSLRCYHPGDGKWFYAMSLRNREHLSRFEADNVAANIPSEAEAETLMGELQEAWKANQCYFVGAFEKKTGDFVAQIYIGPVDWKLPEFQIGYFADIWHQGQGFVTEAVRATLAILFDTLHAHRVSLACDETNLRSIRVAERCQMMREGYLRENRRNSDGSYSGSYIYGLLQQEFRAVGNFTMS